MKLRNLINELNSLKLKHGDDFYEKLLNFDFLVKVINKKDFNTVDETQNIGIYLDDVLDECQIIAYVDGENLAGKECC